MAHLFEHLESFLDECAGGGADDTTPPGVRVVWFGPDVPFDDVTTLVTLGLSNQVFGPRNALFDEGEMTGLVAGSPVYLPDEFGRCDTPAGPAILIWLVPITTGEDHFARGHGWPAPQDVFVAIDPDLTLCEQESSRSQTLRADTGAPGGTAPDPEGV
jgi:hypothetical protein